jgi:hypothetical protein
MLAMSFRFASSIEANPEFALPITLLPPSVLHRISSPPVDAIPGGICDTDPP